MKPQPMFRWNNTPLVIPCDPEIAKAYNRRIAQFEEAQLYFKKKHGRDWYPFELASDGSPVDVPLSMPDDPEAEDAYNLVADLIDILVSLNGGGIAFTESMVDGPGLELIEVPLSMPDYPEAEDAYNLFADLVDVLVSLSGGGITFTESMVDGPGLELIEERYLRRMNNE